MEYFPAFPLKNTVLLGSFLLRPASYMFISLSVCFFSSFCLILYFYICFSWHMQIFGVGVGASTATTEEFSSTSSPPSHHAQRKNIPFIRKGSLSLQAVVSSRSEGVVRTGCFIPVRDGMGAGDGGIFFRRHRHRRSPQNLANCRNKSYTSPNTHAHTHTGTKSTVTVLVTTKATKETPEAVPPLIPHLLEKVRPIFNQKTISFTTKSVFSHTNNMLASTFA